MPNLFTGVRPGDLIKADDMNKVMQAVEALSDRVAKLEAGTPVNRALAITGFSPLSGVRPGDTLHILGRNFGDRSENSVTIDNISVSPTGASSDTELIAVVPNVSVPPEGRIVTVSVGNPRGFVATTLTLSPFVATVPTGNVFINFAKSPQVAKLDADKSYVFIFTIQAIVDLDETYTLVPTVSTGWPAVAVDPITEAVLSPQEITIPKGFLPLGTTREVGVKVTIPLGTPNNTAGTLKLKAISKRNPQSLFNASGGDVLTVNQPPPGGQTDITIAYSSILAPSPGDPAAVRGADDVLAIPVINKPYRLDLSLKLMKKEKYKVEVLPVADAKWKANLVSPSAYDVTTVPDNNLIMVNVTGQSGAGPSEVTVKVSSTTGPAVERPYTQKIKPL
jgi:hypothetical protein